MFRRLTLPIPGPLFPRVTLAAVVAASAALCCAVAAAPAPARTSDGQALLRQARELQGQERWAASDSVATAALVQLERAAVPDSLAMAEACLRIGQARWKLTSFADGVALRSAGRCLDIRTRVLGAEHLDIAGAHSLMARVLAGSDRADSALFHVRRALDIRRQQLGPDDPLVAETLSQLGAVQQARHDLPAATDAYEQALAILRKSYGDEHADVARALCDLGQCRFEEDDLDGAQELQERALAVYTRLSGPDAFPRRGPLNELSTIERARGNLARSVDYLQEAIRVVTVARPQDVLALGLLRANLATRLMQFGDWAGAHALFQSVLPQFESSYGPTHPRTMAVKSSLGIALGGMGNHEEALRLLREVETVLAARPGPPDPNLSVTLRWQAEQLHLMKQDAAAREACERAIRTERVARRPWGEILVASHYLLLSVLEAQGDLAALDSTAHELAPLAEQYAMKSPVTRANVAYWTARADRRLGRHEQAWAEALEADRISRENLVLNVQALPDQRGLEMSERQSRHLELVLELARPDDASEVETAWDRLVQVRGVLRAELARRRIPTALQGDARVVDAHDAWARAQQRLAQRLVATGGVPRDPPAQAALEQLRAAAEEAERKYALAMSGRGTPGQLQPMTLADVRVRLRHDQALVSFVELSAEADTARMIAFVTKGADGALARLELGRSDAIQSAVEAWRAAMARSPGAGSGPASSAERACHELGGNVRRLAWDPIAPHLDGVSDVFIVGDGALLDLPWQALPDGAAGYLVERAPCVHVLNSERELVGPLDRRDHGALVAVGAPDYDLGAGVRVPSSALVLAMRSAPDPCASPAPPALTPLPQTETEVREAAALWREPGRPHKVELLLGSDATEAAVRRRTSGCAVLHLATHSVVARDTCQEVDPALRGVGGVSPVAQPVAVPPVTPAHAASPWLGRRVWLALAGANRARENQDSEDDGLLTAEEVVTLPLHGTTWVVLSSCHTGAAEGWSRDGALGLRRAFHLAGARSVIASQWAVEDVATREWMHALYAARADGARNAATALRSACRSVLQARRRAGESTHPFYWAAFTETGE